MGKTPVRTIRVNDELWDAVKTEAEKRGMTQTDAVIEALTAWLKPTAVLVVAVATMLTLTACGGSSDSPTATATATPTTSSSTISDAEASAIVSAQASAEASASAAADDIALRVAKGECFSTYIGSTAHVVQDALNELNSEAVLQSPPANRLAVAQRLLATLPDDSKACTPDDVSTLDGAREAINVAINDAQAQLG